MLNSERHFKKHGQINALFYLNEDDVLITAGFSVFQLEPALKTTSIPNVNCESCGLSSWETLSEIIHVNLCIHKEQLCE